MATKLAKGVTLRRYPSGADRLQLQFSYRGVTCKEVLKALDPGKDSNIRFANNLKAEIENAKVRGTFVYSDYFPESPKCRLFGEAPNQQTVADAQEALIADLESAGREKTTLASYRRSAARINQRLGTIRVVDLTAADIRKLVRERPATRKTWNNDFIPLRRALKRAVNDGAIQFSPLDRLDLNELVPRSVKPKPDPFTMQEINAILSAAAGYCERAHNLFQTAFFTGMRLEELAGLDWAHADLKAGLVHIQAAAMLSLKSADLKAPKTLAGTRTIELLPQALAALKRQRTITGFRGQNVFCRWYTLEPFNSYEQFRMRWATVLKKADVRYRPMKQTRHTYASHMLSSGFNPLYVAGQMGHSGTALLDTYGTWVADWKDEYQQQKFGG